MVSTWQEQLAKVFPGSNTPLMFEQVRQIQEKAIEDWDSKPHIFHMNGKDVEFFSIGQLGKALGNRSPNTLRAWEREAILPKSPYIKPSSSPNGRRRMYTRGMVEGLVAIACQEGVLWPDKGIRLSDTKFSERAVELFKQIIKENRGNT